MSCRNSLLKCIILRWILFIRFRRTVSIVQVTFFDFKIWALQTLALPKQTLLKRKKNVTYGPFRNNQNLNVNEGVTCFSSQGANGKQTLMNAMLANLEKDGKTYQHKWLRRFARRFELKLCLLRRLHAVKGPILRSVSFRKKEFVHVCSNIKPKQPFGHVYFFFLNFNKNWS